MATREQLSENLYQGLKKHYGALKDVANRMKAIRAPQGKQGYHRNWVRQVLKGEYEDLELMEVAAKVLHEYEENAAAQRQRIQQLTSEALRLATA
ncbi:MAG TPA: hypothetical protein PKD70_11140 [Saprospiraceae bacterium]|nr:hypothetical protein [Saprospiraceae bacterium]HMP14426.1 hypothetical protein [Saprospiraceae bacterium]